MGFHVQRLDQFKKENGHTSATQGSKLGNWIQFQKQEYSIKLTGGKAILTSEQIRVLRALDTFFEIPCNRNFEDNIHDLQFFKDQNKGKDPNHFTMLGNWMDTIRHLYADTKSNTEAVVLSSTDQTHVDQLNKIGFDWKISNGADGTAKSFKRMYGEGKQSSSCNGNHSSNSQSKSTISKMQLKKEQKWNDKLQEMLVHKEEHGNTYPQKNSSLGRWALQQRHAYKLFKDENSNSTLITNENITKLLGIGFDFELHKNKYVKEETEWDGMYEELRVFQEKNGHAVPPTNPLTPLRKWVERQRNEYKKIRSEEKSYLSVSKIQKLNDIGFLFKPKVKTHTWDERFQQLVAFKEKFGHCKVPRLYKGLGKWIADQRGKYNDLKAGKKTNLTNEKAQRLSDLGMIWSIFKSPPREERAERKPWLARFEELLAYKEEFGHTVVPQVFIL